MFIKNRYRIIEEIGRGGMGIVYRVEDTLKDNMIFALKTITQNLIQKHRELSLNKFKDEYEIMTRLKHPNLTRVYEFGEDKDNYYIIMEFLEGMVLGKQKFDNNKTLDIIVQILRVLEYMHCRHILYGDIKPSNIILLGDTVKLMDFGLSTLTYRKDNKIRGSLLYMPPERLFKKNSISSDIFSLGLLFYELYTQGPFYKNIDKSINEIVRLLGCPDEFRDYHQKMLKKVKNAIIRNIIIKMTQYDQSLRYRNCSEIIHDLNSGLDLNYEYETRDTKLSYVLGNAFTNRYKELKSLKYSVKSNSNNVFFIYSGPSGVGKSRLFSEFKKFCKLNGISFFEAVCMEGDIRKYHSFIDVLAQMVALSNESLMSKYGKYLKILLPNNPALKEYIPPDIINNPGLLQDIIVQNVSSFIYECSHKQKDKTILYFNDIQWIDYGSLLIIKGLLTRLADSKHLLLYATHNKDKHSDQNQLDEIFKSPGVIVEELSPFDLDGVKEYIDNVFGADYIDISIKNTAEHIRTKVGSSPLFLQELIKSLLEKNIIIKDKKYWKLVRPIEDEHIPRNIVEIIQSKLDILFEDENRRKILKILSLFKIDLNINTIKAIINKITPLDAAKVLLELEDLEIIQTSNIDNTVFYTYTNSLIKDRIRENIDNKAEISLLIANTLESIYGRESIDLTEEIAYQFQQGQNIEKAVYYYEKCGDNAKDNYFNQKAIHYYQTAIDLLDTVPNEKHIKIMLKMSRILNLIGKWDDALMLYKQTSELSQNICSREFLIDSLYGMGNIYNKLGYSQKSETILKKALNMAQKYGLKRQTARILSYLAVVNSDRGDYDKAIIFSNESIDIFKEIDDIQGIGYCYNSLGNLYWSICDFNRSMEYYLKDLQICKKTNNKFGMGSVYCNIGNNYWDLGDYEKSLEHYIKALDICEELGDRHGIAITNGNIGVFYYYTGEYNRAMDYYIKSLNLYKEIGHTRGTIYSYGNIGLVYYQQKDYGTALKYLDKSIKISRKLNNPYTLCEQLHNKADLFYDTGEIEKAEEINEEALKIAIRVKRTAIIIKCKILKNKIKKDENGLLELLNENLSEEQNARVFYALYKVTKKNKYCLKSREIYGKMLNSFQKIEYKKRFEELNQMK